MLMAGDLLAGTPSLCPAHECERAVMPIPSLTCITPATFAKETSDVALHVLREFELEQIRLLSFFRCGHQRVVAKGAVTTNPFRFAGLGKIIQHLEQSRLSVLCGMFVAGVNLDTQYETQTRHDVGMIGV